VGKRGRAPEAAPAALPAALDAALDAAASSAFSSAPFESACWKLALESSPAAAGLLTRFTNDASFRRPRKTPFAMAFLNASLRASCRNAWFRAACERSWTLAALAAPAPSAWL
jgi:hypothetical protein